jgi:prolyl-tRNA synthetase
MRASRLFFTTLRNTPASADIRSHQLLLRAGYVRQLGAGLFDYLPLGLKVKHKVENIIRQEMDAVGGQEVSMPLVQPAELWQRSGRWGDIDESMVRFTDRAGRELCLAMTHEEAAADLARQVVSSYRQLPALLYQFQTKFRDELRARGGLIRVREFTMKDAYSFDQDQGGLEASYGRVYGAYERIFARCGLEVVAVESDLGMMGGSGGHEFMALLDIGEDTLLLCPRCDYKANQEVATFRKPKVPAEVQPDLEEVATPGARTIEALRQYLGIAREKTAKAVFFMAHMEDKEQFVFAVVRGDMELNETKLKNALGAVRLRPATPEEIRRTGAEPGYASPVGIDRARVTVVVDDSVSTSPNLVAGANREGWHLRNTNYGRDYEADVVADIAAAQTGDRCPRCGAPLESRRGVEVGHIFKLRTRYSEALGATFISKAGIRQPLMMSSYGIGPGRVMACVAETHCDETGLVWPQEVAPFDGVITALVSATAPEVAEVAEQVYSDLTAQGLDVLLDDREESPGVKFKDADLLGLPWRITVGAKGLREGRLELKDRHSSKSASVAPGDTQVLIRALDEIS